MHVEFFHWRTDQSHTLFIFRLVVSNDTASPFWFIKEVPSAPWSVSIWDTWQFHVNNHFDVFQILLIRLENMPVVSQLLLEGILREWKWGASQFVIDSSAYFSGGSEAGIFCILFKSQDVSVSLTPSLLLEFLRNNFEWNYIQKLNL